jgi:hypothetical protein
MVVYLSKSKIEKKLEKSESVDDISLLDDMESPGYQSFPYNRSDAE